jgi:carbamoyl-phosphate synthase large subunit
VINIPKNSAAEELANDYLIRRKAADYGIPLITNIQLAQRFVEAISRKSVGELRIKSWQEYFAAEPAPARPQRGAVRELKPAA